MVESDDMKPYSKVVAVLVLLMFGAAASEPAMARGGHGGSYGRGGGYVHSRGYGGVGLGIALGIPLLLGLGYYSAPYYSYPAYSAPGPAPSGGYIEQGYAQAAPAPGQQQDWYFCAGSNAYYPYVRECPGGWQRVPSQPPR
jgi:hypothetical protein